MTACSLMQKDVLIEEVSAVASQIVKTHLDSFTSLSEFSRCSQLRDQLYRDRPEQIDLEEIHSEFENALYFWYPCVELALQSSN